MFAEDFLALAGTKENPQNNGILESLGNDFFDMQFDFTMFPEPCTSDMFDWRMDTGNIT